MTRKLNKILGFYIPSFFRLHVSTHNSLKDSYKLNDRDFSVFFHEYIHFVQDITTFYGLNCIHASVEYLKYANNFIVNNTGNKFQIPIQPDQSNSDNVLLNGHLCKATYGDVSEAIIKKIINYNITMFDINIPNSLIKEIEIVDIEFLDDKNETNNFSFGSGCIMESMAYLFEQLTCRDYAVSSDLPYNTAELLAKKIYPEFVKNKLNILALCDISLGISNPAKYFVATIEKWKNKQEILKSREDSWSTDYKKQKEELSNAGIEYTVYSTGEKLKDYKGLCIEIEGDLFHDGNGFQSFGYILFVQVNDNKKFSISLSPRQVTENYLFDILIASGISFLKKIAVVGCDDDNQVNEFLEKYNNVLIESPYEQSSLLIEDQGNIVLSNDNLKEDGYNIPFEINAEYYDEDEPVDEIIKQLVEVLNEVDVKVEVF